MRYDMIRPRPLRPGPAVERTRPIFILVDESKQTMVKGQMLPGVRPGYSGARPPAPPQPALVIRDDLLVKGDLIPGGLGDKKTDKDFDPDQLAAGQKVEMEHTKNPKMAREIARDHLTEDKDYYRKLAKMEAGDKVKKGMWPEDRVTAWADQFGGTNLYGQALQCVMDGIKLCRERQEVWDREDRGGNDIRARIQRERDSNALRKKEDALRKRKKDLEEKLVASRIEEEQARSQFNKAGELDVAGPTGLWRRERPERMKSPLASTPVRPPGKRTTMKLNKPAEKMQTIIQQKLKSVK